MSKCLGVVAITVALCALSWAQAPAQAPPTTPATAPDTTQAPPSTPAPDTTQTPPAQPPASTTSTQETTTIPVVHKPGPQFPRLELFAGYSFAQAGFFNSGHWAQLNGWNASFDINLTNHVGFVVDAGEFLGHTQIKTNSPAPFTCTVNCPSGPTFNAGTREYNILFGLQFPFHRRERWTPFGELMFGHDGVRGRAFLDNFNETQVSSGLALVAGGGADYKISDRFALRFKADYLATHTSFILLGHNAQDNLRLSVGVVIRSVRKKKRNLEEEPTE